MDTSASEVLARFLFSFKSRIKLADSGEMRDNDGQFESACGNDGE